MSKDFAIGAFIVCVIVSIVSYYKYKSEEKYDDKITQIWAGVSLFSLLGAVIFLFFFANVGGLLFYALFFTTIFVGNAKNWIRFPILITFLVALIYIKADIGVWISHLPVIIISFALGSYKKEE
jgi:hypothetical protein